MHALRDSENKFQLFLIHRHGSSSVRNTFEATTAKQCQTDGKVTLNFPLMRWVEVSQRNTLLPPSKNPMSYLFSLFGSVNNVSHQVQLMFCVFVLEINHRSEGLFATSFPILSTRMYVCMYERFEGGKQDPGKESS